MEKGWLQAGLFCFPRSVPLSENEFRLHSINFYYIALQITPIPPRGHCMIPYTWSNVTTTVPISGSALRPKRPEAGFSLQITFLTGTGPARPNIQTHTT